jgi:hypothetical protein
MFDYGHKDNFDSSVGNPRSDSVGLQEYDGLRQFLGTSIVL